MLRNALIKRLFCQALLLNLLVLAASSASALVTVGPDTGPQGCTYRTIQQAINYVHGYERDNPAMVDPYIAVAGGYVYNEALVVNDANITNYTDPTGFRGAYIQIYGNYDDTCQVQTNSTALIGAGGSKANNSVLEISGRSHVNLRYLTLTQASGVARGGGINFHGSGILELADVLVTNNHANLGGGIFAHGDTPGISILLNDYTQITQNIADAAGGGIRIEGEAHLYMTANFTVIDQNSADPNDNSGDPNTGFGVGGGLQVIGAFATADIGSPGFVNDHEIRALFTNNRARYGGAIGVQDNGNVRIFSTVAGYPPRLEQNTATQVGGGIFVGVGSSDGSGGNLCGFGYGINNNTAKDGAAIYVDYNSGGITSFGSVGNLRLTQDSIDTCDSHQGPVGPIACPVGVPCNAIDYNLATDDGGAVISVPDSQPDIEQVAIQGNAAGSILRASDPFGNGAAFSLRNCLISNNVLRHDVIRTAGHIGLDIDGCTIARDFNGSSLLSTSGPVSVQRSILWQPGGATLTHSGSDQVVFQDSIANDADTLAVNTSTNFHSYDPKFIDPINGNFHLSELSPAIDYSLAGTTGSAGGTIDLDGNQRGVDNRFGGNRFDIGAYELQNLLPPTFPNDENFDELDAPTLPSLWASAHSGAGTGWATTTESPDTAQLAAFTSDPPNTSDSTLETSAFVPVKNAQLRFRHQFGLDSNNAGLAYDGAVLEIKIGSAPYADILAAGGHFVAGGYNDTMDISNPIAGRRAWSGTTGGYHNVIVDLPTATNNQIVRLRWRVTTGVNNFQAGTSGYWLDTIHVDLDLPVRDEIFSDGLEVQTP